MELFENDLTLPGVITEIISDYSSGYDTSLFGTTESMVVIGTAFNGPVGRAVEVYSPEHARYVFGQSYNPKTKKEATLVSNIQDAWNAGCRTIYAVRVSGKDIYKDYNLTTDTNFKLRVSGIFPSNSNKDLSMLLNIAEQNLYVKIFKPASRATINEKKQGLVERIDSVLTNTLDLTNMGFSLDSDLVDLITRVNEYTHNNVIKLAIVDEDGNDVTLASSEARSLKVRNLFSGLYTIGRSKTLGIPNTIVKVEAVDGVVTKTLKINSDVTADYPIFAETKNELSAYLRRPMATMFDFVTVTGAIDEVFEKDAVDYEEVELTEMELYQKLGSGYAINAQIVETNGRYRVKEVDDSNPNKKTEIKDGIYSMLENLDAKYRVLASISADAKIKDRLPRKEEFKKALSKESLALEDVINVETVVDPTDLTAAKSYKVEFIADRAELPENIEKLLAPDVAKIVSSLNPEDLNKRVNYKEGSLFLGDNEGSNQLFIVRNGYLTPLHADAKDALAGTYVIADNLLYVCVGNSYVAASKARMNLLSEEMVYMTAMLENGSFVIVKIIDGTDSVEPPMVDNVAGQNKAGEATVTKTKKKTSKALSGLRVEVIGTVEQVFSKEEPVYTAITSHYGENHIKIYSADFDVLTVEEVLETLAKDKDFSKLFNVSIHRTSEAQEIMQSVIEGTSTESRILEFAEDKEIAMDVNKFIPYRTDDNFARHLAQHCMYTSLKTAPTHGVIGTKTLLDTSLTSIANRVKELANLRMESTLVGKKPNGTDMLDRNNLPYPIGRKVSITAGQYIVTTDDGYSFVSNMAAGYAGMVSCLPLDQSSTCQPINIPTPMYELTNFQLGLLTQAGFVTAKKSYSKGWVVTDGITMAPSDSPYKRLSASRIADGIEAVIRTVCEPFIGKVNNLANQNSLRSALKSELDKLKGKIIEDYEFSLIADKTSNSMGILDINYAIIPVYEIKQIRNHITIKE